MAGRRRIRVGAVALVAATVGAACVPPPHHAHPRVDPDAPTILDCTDWRYGPADEPAPGVLPAEYDRDNYKRTSKRDSALADSPQNQCGQKGAAADLAWGVTKGSDEVLIAVLDSGIRWRDPGSMADLATKAYINLGEARPDCAADPEAATSGRGGHHGHPRSGDGDCNGDGVFDIADFGAIADRNGNGVADPEDLILDPAYSNGVDDDGNGYVDDISGWDFLYGDNDPLDTVDYGHGTGEAKDSSAAENGAGSVGSCPGCRFVPVRVGDSFITDGGRFAAGVLFGLDSGADVVQEALGVLSNPAQAQQAIDAAYRRGVVVVASMADEASKHPNLPASLEHTMAVNSITEKEPPLGGAVEGYLALNGCTNFGGHTFVSIPSGACSSEATGQAAGYVGLLESAARQFGVRPHPSLARGHGRRGGNPLSANEAMQLVRSTADDVDFATPNGVDPANNFGTPSGGLLDTVRYPTTPGWDATTGYGRVNAYELVQAVRDGRIPPEADLTSPAFFDLLPAAGTLRVRGSVAAVRAHSYDYRVEWTTALQPPDHPDTDTWHVVAEGRGLRHPVHGTLGRLDLAEVAAALPDGATGAPVDPATGRPAEERFTVRVRVVVTAHGGPGDSLVGISQKQVFVHDDPDLDAAASPRVAGAGTCSPVLADLDGRPGDELIVATDDGWIHAFGPDGRDVRGWPVRGVTPTWWPTRSPVARQDHIRPAGAGFAGGGPIVADLDGDGHPEVVAADFDGNVWVFDHDGRRHAGFEPVRVEGHWRSPVHVDLDYSRDDPAAQDQYNRTKPGFGASPVAADLDGDGTLEIVATALDRHLYAWHADGTAVDGFPVLVVDPAKVQAVDPVTHKVTFTADSGVREGGELIAAPAVADLTGDGTPEIVVGAQEEYQEPVNIGDGGSVLGLLGAVGASGNSRLYVIDARGTNATNPGTNPAHPAEQAYLPGWPFSIGLLGLETFPVIGDGVAMQPVVGDVSDASEGPEIVAAAAVGPVYVLDEQGRSVLGEAGGKALPLAWAGGLFGEGNGRFGALRTSDDIVASIVDFAGASIGDLDGTGRPDVSAPAAGLTRLLDIQASDLQLPNDDLLMAWRADTGDALPGFPQATSDMAFFVVPAIADLDGDGHAETIAGSGVYLLQAHAADGSAPAGWPKLTGGWVVGTPALGDLDGDGTAELATVRRDGQVLVWHTAQPAAGLTEWPRAGGNDRNTGEYRG